MRSTTVGGGYGGRVAERTITPRPKYRGDVVQQDDDALTEPDTDDYYPINIHQDPRVARVNTYARRPVLPPIGTASSSKKRVKPGRVVSIASQRAALSAQLYDPNYGTYNNQKQELDLSKYLVAPEPQIEDDASERINRQRAPASMPFYGFSDSVTQTDEFAEKPDEVYYKQPLGGADAATEVINTELFDFDREIKPLLDVLIGKTLEQAKLEVERSWELQQIAQATDRFNAERVAEARAQEQLEAAAIERRRAEEAQRRAAAAAALSRWQATQKVAAVCMMRQCWPGVLRGACEALRAAGRWCEPRAIDIADEFMPWLLDSVGARAGALSAAYAVTDGLCEEALRRGEALAEAHEAAVQREAKEAAAASAAAGATTQLWVEGAAVGLEGGKLGPVTVTNDSSIAAVEKSIADWFEENGLAAEVPEGGFLSLSFDCSGVDAESVTLTELKERGGLAEAEQVTLGSA
ncbi:radial spoke protein 3-domain-containing protein [Tribonema minus]|uniref:Radial spoke protein 3-domain-containing protein n=1 Tax=Tribonema minus TaxID=303371 RepID=A0A835YQI5_9STRA|nr:radial spoke protein 3-domain-containing protein [Tribonema minus]